MDKKSVSEIKKITRSQKKEALNKAKDYAINKTEEIFKKQILPNLTQKMRFELIKKSLIQIEEEEKSITTTYVNTIDNILCIYDILLSTYSIDGLIFENDTVIFPSLLPPKGEEKSYAEISCLIHKNINDFLSDEYCIENNKIYSTRNQKIVRALKDSNCNDLDIILNESSVSGNQKNAIFNLCTFLENHRNKIESRLGKAQGSAIFNFANNTKIRHNKNTEREPTQEELEVFFDFGLSLARLVEIWKKEV